MTTTGPVDKEIFAAYRGSIAYDRSALEVTVDSVDESSPHWRKGAPFDAAYGNERLSVHLFVPRNASRPIRQ